MDSRTAVLAYQQAQITTANPDAQGVLLYEAAQVACQSAREAQAQGDLTAARRAAFRAADILAALADASRNDSPAARLFRTGNALAWQRALGYGLHPEDAARQADLAEAEAWCAECLRQLRQRLASASVGASAGAGW